MTTWKGCIAAAAGSTVLGFSAVLVPVSAVSANAAPPQADLVTNVMVTDNFSTHHGFGHCRHGFFFSHGRCVFFGHPFFSHGNFGHFGHGNFGHFGHGNFGHGNFGHGNFGHGFGGRG